MTFAPAVGDARTHAMALSHDGALLAVAGVGGTVRVRNLPSGADRHTLRLPAAAGGIAFSPDGRELAVAGADSGVWLFDAVSGSPRSGRLDQAVTRNARAGIAFSTDGRLMATAAKRIGSAKLWDLASGGRTANLGAEPPVPAALSVAFRADGSVLATGHQDRTVRLWPTHSGLKLPRPLDVLDGSSAPVTAVLFSPDGKYLAAAALGEGVQGGVRLWELPAADGARPRLLEERSGHQGGALCLAFTPDGRVLASGHRDGTIRLWTTSESAARTVAVMPAPVRGLAFTPDAKHLAAASEDGTVTLWSPAP